MDILQMLRINWRRVLIDHFIAHRWLVGVIQLWYLYDVRMRRRCSWRVIVDNLWYDGRGVCCWGVAEGRRGRVGPLIALITWGILVSLIQSLQYILDGEWSVLMDGVALSYIVWLEV